MPVCKYCLGEFQEIDARTDHDLVAHSWPKCRDRAADDAVLVRSLLRLRDFHDMPAAVKMLYERGSVELDMTVAGSSRTI